MFILGQTMANLICRNTKLGNSATQIAEELWPGSPESTQKIAMDHDPQHGDVQDMWIWYDLIA